MQILTKIRRAKRKRLVEFWPTNYSRKELHRGLFYGFHLIGLKIPLIFNSNIDEKNQSIFPYTIFLLIYSLQFKLNKFACILF